MGTQTSHSAKVISSPMVTHTEMSLLVVYDTLVVQCVSNLQRQAYQLEYFSHRKMLLKRLRKPGERPQCLEQPAGVKKNQINMSFREKVLL